MTHPSPDTLLCNLCDPFLIPVLWSLWLHLAPIPHYICYPFYTLYQLIHVTNLILMNSIYFSGPLALGSSYIYFSLRAKWWLQGGVGGRFPSGWNSEWARWSESSAFSMATRAGDVGPLGISALVSLEKNSVFSHNKNKFVIDQACSVKMAVRCPSPFSRIYWPRLRLAPRPIFSHIDLTLGQ